MGRKGECDFNTIILPLLGFQPDVFKLEWWQKSRLQHIMKVTGWRVDSPPMVFLVAESIAAHTKYWAGIQHEIGKMDERHYYNCRQLVKKLRHSALGYVANDLDEFWLRELSFVLKMRAQTKEEKLCYEISLCSLRRQFEGRGWT